MSWDRTLRDAWLNELWTPSRELSRDERAKQREAAILREDLITARAQTVHAESTDIEPVTHISVDTDSQI